MKVSVSGELLDVVDECDRVTGVKTRGEIHARGLMHRAVHILVFNPRRDLLVQKRSILKDENPGLWDSSCAGHVDSGETYAACARRELGEELGMVSIPRLEYLFHFDPSADNGMEHSHVYRCHYAGLLHPQVEEIDELAWWRPEHVDRLVGDEESALTRVFRDIWRRYRETV